MEVNMKDNLHFCVIQAGTGPEEEEWALACREHGVRYDMVDLSRQDWLERCLAADYDCFLTRPPGDISYIKQLYDERLYALHVMLGKKIYPTYEEILIYENKRMLAYWLEANSVPHPRYHIFYQERDALQFAAQCALPIVAKSSIGASGYGVNIIKSRGELQKYIRQAFSGKGIMRRFGPNLRKEDLGGRTLQAVLDFPAFYRKIKNRYTGTRRDPQRWFVILQEYLNFRHEWRVVRIGESFFAHQKLPVRGMHSGTSRVKWVRPPESLLDFVREVTDKRGFLSQAVDIFEDEQGRYFVNELQCFFGSHNPHQMIVDNQPGRFVMSEGSWTFEPGTFNMNNSYHLRLEHVVRLLEEGTL
jgi:glutathione synthase/RimK-type ligase-like ATP-grasp enzyme